MDEELHSLRGEIIGLRNDLAQVKSRVDQHEAMLSSLSAKITSIMNAVCGDISNTSQESLIAMVRRMDQDNKRMNSELVELTPIKRLYWGAVAVLGVVNAPILLYFLNQFFRQ